LVAMRTRNPCVRLRRRRFGWKVTLIVGSLAAKDYRRRNLDSNHGAEYCQSFRGLPPRLSGAPALCYSRVPCARRRVSPRSFPQLWKKMWKSKGFPAVLPPRSRREATLDRAKA
jgi:hypothetical protein